MPQAASSSSLPSSFAAEVPTSDEMGSIGKAAVLTPPTKFHKGQID